VLSWKQQGPAFTASVILEGGEHASAVVVGPRDNPRGAAIVRRGTDGAEQMLVLSEALSLLRGGDIIEIYCMQERAFGGRGFPAPLVHS
jgi:hypothetical protein